jgi:diguanylate cyclase (GGDEF)-like protein
VFKALIVECDANTALVQDALAEAGCIEVLHASLACASEHAVDVIVTSVAATQLPQLAATDIPIVAICDVDSIDAVHAAGAAVTVTAPLRPRELLGRVRWLLHERTEQRARMNRERHMSETIVALTREKEDLERLVCVDALTGIANRRHALALLGAEWGRSTRENLPLGLVMIDLDCYHAYNEQYGHLGGDTCLQLVCEAMVKCLRRPSDYLGRYGGEEFMAVLPNTDAVGAKLVAERLRASVEALAIPHVASVCAKVVTITAGFASLRVMPDLTMDRLISAADAALLRAKAQGRNRIGGEAPLVRPSRVSAERWQRHEPVFADPWFADRIPAFFAEVHAGARAIVQSLRRDELDHITHVAARLRTTASSLSLPAVELIAGNLERAATAADMLAAREAADALVEYVTHVQVIYRRPSEPALPRLVG